MIGAVVRPEQLGSRQIRFDSDGPGGAVADRLEPGEREPVRSPSAAVPAAAAVGGPDSNGAGFAPPVARVDERRGT